MGDNNKIMKTIDFQADLNALCESVAHNGPVDPDIALRVQERAEEVRVELRAKGTTKAAVDLIRQTRDE